MQRRELYEEMMDSRRQLAIGGNITWLELGSSSALQPRWSTGLAMVLMCTSNETLPVKKYTGTMYIKMDSPSKSQRRLQQLEINVLIRLAELDGPGPA